MEEFKLLPSSGLITLNSLADFLGVDPANLRDHLITSGISLFEYDKNKYLISLKSLTHSLRYK
jgi:hypothetical protein